MVKTASLVLGATGAPGPRGKKKKGPTECGFFLNNYVEKGPFLALFAALLKVGFRNIHGIIHHQTENFAQGMPTDLAFRLAARQAVFAHLEATQGEGWWGAPTMESYYEGHAAGDNPFNWIRIHPLMPPEVAAHFPFDHAGEGETALMLALAPETVEAARMAQNTAWYTQTAPKATKAQGEAGVAVILDHLKTLLDL